MNEVLIQKFDPEYGTMKQSGVGQYVRLFDYRTLEGERHKLDTAINKIDDKIRELHSDKLITMDVMISLLRAIRDGIK